MSLIMITLDEKLVHNRMKRNTSHVHFYVGYIAFYKPLVENINISATNGLNIYGYFTFSELLFVFVKLKAFKLALLPNYNVGVPWRRFQNTVFPVFPCGNCSRLFLGSLVTSENFSHINITL
jgi:hypothetical protein